MKMISESTIYNRKNLVFIKKQKLGKVLEITCCQQLSLFFVRNRLELDRVLHFCFYCVFYEV